MKQVFVWQCTRYFSKLFKVVSIVLKSSFFTGYIVMIKETVGSKHRSIAAIFIKIKIIFKKISKSKNFACKNKKNINVAQIVLTINLMKIKGNY